MKGSEQTTRIFSRKYLQKIFNKIDGDHDGKITYQELQSYVQRRPDFLPKNIMGMIKEKADRNDDLKLNVEGFIEMMDSTRYNNRMEMYMNKYLKLLLPPPPPSGGSKKSHTAPVVMSADEPDSSVFFPLKTKEPQSAPVTISIPPKMFARIATPPEIIEPPISTFQPIAATFQPTSTMFQPTSTTFQPTFQQNFRSIQSRLTGVSEEDEPVVPRKPTKGYTLLDIEEPTSRPESIRSLGSKSVEKLIIPSFYESDEDIFDDVEEHVYHCWPPKLAMVVISLIEIILFVIDANVGNSWMKGPIAQSLIYTPLRRKEVWRYLTYMLVHTGVWHLGVNVFIQIILGAPLEMAHKWWCVIVVYSCGVIAGSLGSSITNSHAPLAGASGGVYALITAHIVSVLLNWKRMNYPLPQLFAFLVIICTDLSINIINYSSGNADHSISYAAHFFGGLSGLLVGTIVLENCGLGEHRKIIGYIFVVLCSILVFGAIIYNIVAENNFPKQHI